MAPPFDIIPTKEEWINQISEVNVNRNDMNKLIMNYLVTEGFKDAAEMFRAETNIESDVPLDSLDARIRIRTAVESGAVSRAISLVNDLHPEILDNDRNCFYQLQQQFFIELIKKGEIDEAISFAQTHLSEHVSKEDLTIVVSLERVLSLLAFLKPEASPFGELLNQSQRCKVANQVNTAILKYESKDSTSNIGSIFKLTMWAQQQLDSNKVVYHRMEKLEDATF